MIAFDGASLPEEERLLLDILGRQPGWRVWPTETSVDATVREFTVRFSGDRTPLIVTPELPDGYPFALAAFVARCVHSGKGTWWMSGVLSTADQWQRIALADYVPHWGRLLQWLHLAPRDLLDTAFDTLRDDVHSDADAGRAALALVETIRDSLQYPNLSAFFAHLDAPQTTVAQQMVAAGWEIETFWGPEQMDVWRLTLARGPARASFGIERGIAYFIDVHHELLRDRGSFYGWPSYSQVWMAWKWRTKTLGRDPDPFAIASDTTEWPALFDWLVTASRPDVATIDALRDVTYELQKRTHGLHPDPATPEERIEATRRALGKGR